MKLLHHAFEILAPTFISDFSQAPQPVSDEAFNSRLDLTFDSPRTDDCNFPQTITHTFLKVEENLSYSAFEGLTGPHLSSSNSPGQLKKHKKVFF